MASSEFTGSVVLWHSSTDIAKFSMELLLLQTCVGLATSLLWCDEVLAMVAPPCGRMKRGLALEQLGMLDACVTLQWCGGLAWLDCYYGCGHMVAPPLCTSLA